MKTQKHTVVVHTVMAYIHQMHFFFSGGSDCLTNHMKLTIDGAQSLSENLMSAVHPHENDLRAA